MIRDASSQEVTNQVAQRAARRASVARTSTTTRPSLSTQDNITIMPTNSANSTTTRLFDPFTNAMFQAARASPNYTLPITPVTPVIQVVSTNTPANTPAPTNTSAPFQFDVISSPSMAPIFSPQGPTIGQLKIVMTNLDLFCNRALDVSAVAIMKDLLKLIVAPGLYTKQIRAAVQKIHASNFTLIEERDRTSFLTELMR